MGVIKKLGTSRKCHCHLRLFSALLLIPHDAHKADAAKHPQHQSRVRAQWLSRAQGKRHTEKLFLALSVAWISVFGLVVVLAVLTSNRHSILPERGMTASRTGDSGVQALWRHCLHGLSPQYLSSLPCGSALVPFAC